ILQIISWVPEGQTEAVTMPFTSESLAELQEKVADARATGKAQVVVPGTPKPMPLAEAERIASTFSEVQLDAAAGNFDPEKPKRGHVERKAPVLLPNIDKVDYSEG